MHAHCCERHSSGLCRYGQQWLPDLCTARIDISLVCCVNQAKKLQRKNFSHTEAQLREIKRENKMMVDRLAQVAPSQAQTPLPPAPVGSTSVLPSAANSCRPELQCLLDTKLFEDLLSEPTPSCPPLTPCLVIPQSRVATFEATQLTAKTVSAAPTVALWTGSSHATHSPSNHCL